MQSILLLRQVGIQVDGQLIILRPIDCDLFLYKLPQPIFLLCRKILVMVQNMLGGWNDLQCTFFLRIIVQALFQEVRLRCLQLFDLLCKGGISLEKHLYGA